MQLSSVVASRWFSKRQGLVIGLMTSATAIGTLIFMSLAATISDLYGWRTAMAIPTIGSVISIILFYFFAWNSPENINITRFSETEVSLAPEPYNENFIVLSFKALFIGMRTKLFWI
ncbi:MFS transporter [Amylibacter sp.]|nr:MFS transporter [Amylibacter sp.]